MREIQTKSSIEAVIRMPGSKSITHRALIAAGLARGESILDEALFCEDTYYTVCGLRELDIGISAPGSTMKVAGRGGEFSPSPDTTFIYLGNSGTSYRLLLSTVALARGNFILAGSTRMRERPIGELASSLNKLGAEISYYGHDGFPPVSVKARGIRGGKVEIGGEVSSQYISSLLLAGPYMENGVEIEVKGTLVSRPYVDVTVDVMRQFGVVIRRDHYCHFAIESGQQYQARSFTIEGDVSNASYFWAAAAVTGGTVTTENISSVSTSQGDRGFLDILEAMGCQVLRERDRVTVNGGVLSGIDVDMSAMPDMVPTLAAIALFAHGKTIIRNVSHLRYKESNRLEAIASEWGRLGARVDKLIDGIIIHGEERLSATLVDPHDDHRLAMSFAVIGLRVPRIKIKNERCVNKSFPGFWILWNSL
jgi:3-phosphoshikimate 1-carboxyvinyltransferase